MYAMLPSRPFGLGTLIALILAASAFGQNAFAQKPPCKEACWIDVKTGQSVPTVPLGGVNMHMDSTVDAGVAVISGDRQTAFNTRTKQNFARESDGSWIDVKTGKCVTTAPLSGVNMHMDSTVDAGVAVISGDRQTAFNTRTKQNYARVPCPPPAAAAPPATPQVGMVTPPTVTPKLIPAPPGDAQQNLNQPDCATAGGQSLRWDPNRNSWINASTGQALGYQGLTARDGTPVPAPPVISPRTGGKHQAKQDPDYPESAHDPVTGQDLKWDRDQGTWIDTKTGKPVGFQGASVSSATPVGLATCYAMTAPAPTGSGFGFGFGFGVGTGGGDHGDDSDRVQPERQTLPKKP